jgi:threonine/homoserine/homoserine lactone efflux protein
MRAAFERMGHWINRVTGLVFILLGVRIALQRAN